MSVAFNSSPVGLPLSRILAAFFVARGWPTRDLGVRQLATSTRVLGRDHSNMIGAVGVLDGDLWQVDREGRGLDLDITSVQNSKVKYMRSFHKRRTRADEGKTLVEGHRLVCDLIEGGHKPALVLVSPEALDASPGPRLQAALETLSADVVAIAAPEIVQRCCDTVTSQGVVALVDMPVLPFPTTLRTILICDGIQDPGNLGTLVRTATGLGADAVVLTGTCVDYWAPKTVRSSMGASFRLPSLKLESWEEVVELMQTHGVRMYAAEGGAELSHFDADWTSPSALVVGAEARGLGESARRGLDSGEVVGVSIPLAGGVESLNAAVAGAVVLGEAQRQRTMSERGGAVRSGVGITAQ